MNSSRTTDMLRRAFVCSALTLAVATGGGCSQSDGSQLRLLPIGDRKAYVGQEFTLDLETAAPKDSEPTFSFTACRSTSDGCEVRDLSQFAKLRAAGNQARFQWSPQSTDVGSYLFDFQAALGSSKSSETIKLDVLEAMYGAEAPVFREPSGTGLSFNPAQKRCLELNVVVDDPDSRDVEISQVEPLIDGATLGQIDALTAVWRWCPTEEQMTGSDRYVLRLQADDHVNPPTIKPYLIVLRKLQREDCPGQAPVIDHTPLQSISTVGQIEVVATIRDDLGLKYEPLLYYSFEPPGNPPDITGMGQITMSTHGGNWQQGTWSASIPNPVASEPAGTSSDVYYIISAQDNDDAAGDCDHYAESPASGTHKFRVTNPGGSGGLGLCEPCSADNQCGNSTGDLCVRVGSQGKNYCSKSCKKDSDCPRPEYTCSPSPLRSVNGVSGRQCVPASGSCEKAPVCADDKWEPNDSIDAVKNGGKSLPPGKTTDLVLCPSALSFPADDWYVVNCPATSKLVGLLEGQAGAKLTFSLIDLQGYQLAGSNQPGNSDIFEACIPRGKYFMRVASSENSRTTYSIEYSMEAEPCIAQCVNDRKEPDNTQASARKITLKQGTPYRSGNNVICPGDEDWFRLELKKGDVIATTIAFTQTSAAQDLDLFLYRGDQNLTPCNKNTGANCKPKNGHSTTSNERLVWNIDQDAVYYMVVRGFKQAQNKYDICIGKPSSLCPAL